MIISLRSRQSFALGWVRKKNKNKPKTFTNYSIWDYYCWIFLFQPWKAHVRPRFPQYSSIKKARWNCPFSYNHIIPKAKKELRLIVFTFCYFGTKIMSSALSRLYVSKPERERNKQTNKQSPVMFYNIVPLVIFIIQPLTRLVRYWTRNAAANGSSRFLQLIESKWQKKKKSRLRSLWHLHRYIVVMRDQMQPQTTTTTTNTHMKSHMDLKESLNLSRVRIYFCFWSQLIITVKQI